MPAAIAMLDTNMCYRSHSAERITHFRLSRRCLISLYSPAISNEISEQRRDMNSLAADGEGQLSSSESFARVESSNHWVGWEIAPWRRGSEVNRRTGAILGN